jgi:hypothetical protein
LCRVSSERGPLFRTLFASCVFLFIRLQYIDTK